MAVLARVSRLRRTVQVMSVDYGQVPNAPADAEPDPYWLKARDAGWGLPIAYMPPAMAGAHPGWMKLAAWVLITVFLTATTGGICLTYGPGR